MRTLLLRNIIFCRILNLFAVVAAAGGFGAIYLNKEIAGKKHFTTWHGLFGLITCVGVLLAGAGGLLAKYTHLVKDYVRPINVKLYHATGAMLGEINYHLPSIITKYYLLFSVQCCHGDNVPCLLLKLVQEQSGWIFVEMHVLVTNCAHDLCC